MTFMKTTLAFVLLALILPAGSFGQRRIEYISKVKYTPPLAIPDEAKDSGLGGKMDVWVDLDADGNVISVESVDGPGTVCRDVTRPDVVALRKAAREAAKLAKFEPVIEDGKRQLASGVVRFEIPNGKSEKPSEDQILDLGLLSATPKDGSESFLKRTAIVLPRPPYPPAARVLRASGPVSIKILIDESGAVFSAHPISGHPLLRASAGQAACKAKFRPTILTGKPVKVIGIVTYNFVP